MRLEFGAQVNPPEGWTTKETRGSGVLSDILWERSLTANREDLESLCASKYGVGKHTLRKIADLKLEIIVKRFKRAVSSPIRVS
jgi:hypothetical protein